MLPIEGFTFRGIPSGAVPLALGKQLTAAAQIWGERITTRALQTAPRATGYLASQHYYTVTLDGEGHVTLIVGNRAGYATVVHEGSRPHEILPRTARVLRFTVGGQVVFANRVWHPGTKPQPWLWEATIGILYPLTGSNEVLLSLAGPGETIAA